MVVHIDAAVARRAMVRPRAAVTLACVAVLDLHPKPPTAVVAAQYGIRVAIPFISLRSISHKFRNIESVRGSGVVVVCSFAVTIWSSGVVVVCSFAVAIWSMNIDALSFFFGLSPCITRMQRWWWWCAVIVITAADVGEVMISIMLLLLSLVFFFFLRPSQETHRLCIWSIDVVFRAPWNDARVFRGSAPQEQLRHDESDTHSHDECNVGEGQDEHGEQDEGDDDGGGGDEYATGVRTEYHSASAQPLHILAGEPILGTDNSVIW